MDFAKEHKVCFQSQKSNLTISMFNRTIICSYFILYRENMRIIWFRWFLLTRSLLEDIRNSIKWLVPNKSIYRTSNDFIYLSFNHFSIITNLSPNSEFITTLTGYLELQISKKSQQGVFMMLFLAEEQLEEARTSQIRNKPHCQLMLIDV